MPHELTHDEILQLIDDFAHCAQLAREAGYDGVEVMGSEGYLINEFSPGELTIAMTNGAATMPTVCASRLR